MQYGLTSKLMLDLSAKSPFLKNQGITDYASFQGWIEGVQLADLIKMSVVAVNELSRWDALFAPIIKEGYETVYVEKYIQGAFERGSIDTQATSSRPRLSQIVVGFNDYQYATSINIKQILLKSEDKLTIVDDVLGATIPAYQRLHRVLALRAMTYLPDPSVDKSTNPGFYRYIPADPIYIYDNGFKTFAATETHYMFGVLAENTPEVLVKKIRSKGRGNSGVNVIASDSTWGVWKGLFTKDNLEANQLIEYFEDSTGANNMPVNPNRRTCISLSDADMPTGYFLAYDRTVKGLYRRINENPELKGLFPAFTSNEMLANRQQAEFKVLGLGYGVIDRGFGAVMYVGAYDEATDSFPVAPTAYVSPDLTKALSGWEA